ncbi:hypothetical protein [uncultured Acetobacteroides sp.]|uniref:hypothetical protein n=1 Tax=uncultured Acetobacteroides sp. TaxID=1760811 RepID=UPI0029F5AE79|nr:hypothetical protein [uncultured Acetobacteroides sp.]
MKEHFEMVIHSAEHVSLLTKVLMMFSRRQVDVVSVQSQDQPGGYLYRIVFRAERDEAARLLLQVKRAVDILEAQLAYHSMADVPLKSHRTSRIVHVNVA